MGLYVHGHASGDLFQLMSTLGTYIKFYSNYIFGGTRAILDKLYIYTPFLTEIGLSF